MNNHFLLALFTICIIFFTLPSCEDKEEDKYPVNDWIYENMKSVYLWNDQMPGKTNKSLSPEAYFESLRYSSDRFSVIHENYVALMNSLSGVNMEAGYDYTLILFSETGKEVIGCVNYIKPNSPAEAANLKRGDYFMEVNGTQITEDNYRTLLSQTLKPHSLGKVIYDDNNTIIGIEPVSLQVVAYKENPIYLDTIYHINGKNIGYLVYNFFARDENNGGIAYEKQLNEVFGKFKSGNVNELILDLRYNGGGTIITAAALASMIVPDLNTSAIFAKSQYNPQLHADLKKSIGENFFNSYFIDRILRFGENGHIVLEEVPVNNIGVKRLHVIMSGASASASELVINGLKPFMDVVLVGNKSYGKNVGAILVYEEDIEKQKTNSWGMLPIVLKIANSVGFSGYSNGFAPDIEVYEHHYKFEELGNTSETMLATALQNITGEKSKHNKNQSVNNQTEIIGSSIDHTPERQNMYLNPQKDWKIYPLK